MGHVFLLCGPPGAGKTTLLKEISRRNISITQLRRITTRKPRKEEGDKGNRNLEYEFLSTVEFAERLSKGNIANFIEWNGNYYATQISVLEEVFKANENAILLEDIPSVIALKRKYNTKVTVVFIFTTDKTSIMHNIDFASYKNTSNEFMTEWKRRIGLKYDESINIKNIEPNETDRSEYIEIKMARAIHDLAFIVGKIREFYDIFVLANRKDQVEATVNDFLKIIDDYHIIENKTDVSPYKNESYIKRVKDPSKLTIRELLKEMTIPQLWKTIGAIIAAITIVAVGAYKLGSGDWSLGKNKITKANNAISADAKSRAAE